MQNAQLGVVRGGHKLVQDFRCALLESMGNDDLHPTWGSTLDGGIGPQGEYIAGVIGLADRQAARAQIENEIRRIGAQLQERQLQRLKRERLSYNKVTLTASEILVSITDIRMVQAADSLFVTVTLQTGDNQLLNVTAQVAEGG